MPGCSVCGCNNRSCCGDLSYVSFPIDKAQLCRPGRTSVVGGRGGRVVQAKSRYFARVPFEEGCFETDCYQCSISH